MYINKAFVMGNLTRDPEMRSLPSGMKVVSFALATNRSWKDKNGAKQESAEFHNIVAFGKPAEIIAQYCKKGNPLYVEGRIQTRSWEQDGQKKYKTEIVIDNFQFGPKAGGASAGGYSAGKAQDSGEDQTQKGKANEIDTIEYPEETNNLDDIPF